MILLKIFTLLYLSKEVRKHKDTNDFRDAYCGERVQSSKLIARFTAHIDFTICVVSAITLVITVNKIRNVVGIVDECVMQIASVFLLDF